ncbi:MAG TPA: hypothetical protein VHG28_19430, partial [Longimicrobiaceae bacterium]|nr:hypothetical protein [Longimicrobiaceae bacterium]
MMTPRPIRAPAVLAALLGGTLACAAGPAPLAAQVRVPGPSFEEVIGLRTAGSPAISPDGRSIVYTVRTTDWRDNRFDTELWMARQGEASFQITRTEKGSSTSPRWSPDGRWIAFLADRGDRNQVYVLRAAGGEAQKLTAVKEGVNAFRWSPDGKRIAFSSTEAEDDRMRRRKERYGDFAVEDGEFRQAHLWSVDVPADLWAGATCPAPARADSARAADSVRTRSLCPAVPEPRRLTRGEDFTVNGFAWSPDGTRIAFERRSDPLINSTSTADLWVLTLASGESRPLVAGPGYEGNPVWSPDSRWVLYSTAAGDTTSSFYTNGQIAKIPAAGGTPVRLAAEIDEQLGSLAWTPTGIYLLAWEGTRRHLYAVDPGTGRARRLAGTPDAVLAFDFSADGRTLALLAQTPTTVAEVYRTPLAPLRPVAVTDLSRQIEGWGLGTSEVVSWTSTDGERVEGVLHKPRGFDPTRRYPLFVVIHGGPTSIDYPAPVAGYVYPVLQWLARGALVLRPNYRGSA